jgi:hypothetical protein
MNAGSAEALSIRASERHMRIQVRLDAVSVEAPNPRQVLRNRLWREAAVAPHVDDGSLGRGVNNHLHVTINAPGPETIWRSLSRVEALPAAPGTTRYPLNSR